MKLLWLFTLLLVYATILSLAEDGNCTFTTQPSSDDSAIIESILLVSTLDGTLHAVSKSNGFMKWRLEDDPILSVPKDNSVMKRPLFIPNPHDGSLYAFEPVSKGLTKLPFTIPELVHASPCRSVDGVLYTGKKQDMWISVNPITGAKEKIITAADFSKDQCTRISSNLYIGRSEYNIAMYDVKKDQVRWNATYKDYSVRAKGKFKSDHNLLHFASSSDGYLVTVDKNSGKVLWANNFGFPVVAMYVYGKDGDLWKVPVMNMAKETLTYMLQNQNGKISVWENMLQWNAKHSGAETETALSPSLYIGQYLNNLYALPVMKHGSGVGLRPGILLLPGPKGDDAALSDSTALQTETSFSAWKLVGYHDLPDLAEVTFPTIEKENVQKFPLIGIPSKSADTSSVSDGSDDEYTSQESTNLPPMHPIIDFDEKYRRMDHARLVHKRYQELNYKRQHQHRTPASHIGKNRGNINENDTRWSEITFVAVLTSVFTGLIVVIFTKGLMSIPSSPRKSREASLEGWIRIDQIELDPSNIVGRGSEGTVVYMGKFDGRRVAVKRIVPQCFVFADREVALLRESDEHAHVIRYFSMEKDAQFRYIALELCSGTLQEYVENPTFQRTVHLDKTTVLYQAVQGIRHLHSLGIVHRDVKPSNILISFQNQLGQQRVVISDFGLCKKLIGGRCSFSQRSGMAGTDGWIAPEMILTEKYRMTRAVDIFSMGCVCYYILCGKHPFGDSLTRQSKIVKGECSLKELDKLDFYSEAFDLIQCMLYVEPDLRPSADTVVNHPLFWSTEKKLRFLLDASDRIEKEPVDSNVMLSLENDDKKLYVHGGDWFQNLSLPLQVDLRRFRAYRGDSIRDLLRAMRNKKHHYRELSEDVKLSLGSIPDEFLTYFAKRFPLLLMHTFHSMSVCREEKIFLQYYSPDAGIHLFQREFVPDKHPHAAYMQQKDIWSPFSPKRRINNNTHQALADMDMDWRARPTHTFPDNRISAKSNCYSNVPLESDAGLSRSPKCRGKEVLQAKVSSNLVDGDSAELPGGQMISKIACSDGSGNTSVLNHSYKVSTALTNKKASEISPTKISYRNALMQEVPNSIKISPSNSDLSPVKTGSPEETCVSEYSTEQSEQEAVTSNVPTYSDSLSPDSESNLEIPDEGRQCLNTVMEMKTPDECESNSTNDVAKKKKRHRRGKKKSSAQSKIAEASSVYT